MNPPLLPSFRLRDIDHAIVGPDVTWLYIEQLIDSHANDPPIATVNGVKTFSVTFGSMGQRIYHVEFGGDTQYASSSNTVTVNVV